MPNSLFKEESNQKSEELLSTVDVNKFITSLKVHAQATLDKLKAFSERSGRRQFQS